MANYIHKKRYDNHFGLDLKATDLIRPENFVSSMLNAEYMASGAINKRKGYQVIANLTADKIHGIFSYNKINPRTFADESQIIGVGASLYKLNSTTITVTYSGAATSALLSVFYSSDDSEYQLTLSEDNTTVLTQSLGIGFDEVTPYTIADLVTDITAVTNFSAVASGDSTVPAAFTRITRDYDLIVNDFVGTSYYWNAINQTVSAPFQSSIDNKENVDFENLSFAQLRNVAYLSNGYDDLHKYDGQTCYKAGLPDVSSLTAVKLAVAGNLTGDYFYRTRYIQYDAAGNIVEGNVLDPVAHTGGTLASETMTVTVGNIQTGSGFNTNSAQVDGNQNGVLIIIVDAGHTMKVGDTAFFWDGVQSKYIQREVTGIAATTITISTTSLDTDSTSHTYDLGGVVNVVNNYPISNNLRIGLYRIKNAGTIYYLVEELPNFSGASTQQYIDDIADSSLTIELVLPITDRSLPPKGKYITTHQNLLIVAGNYEDRNLVYWSDIDFPEYFPSGANFEIMDTVAGDVITGVISSGPYLAIGKTRSMRLMSGTLGDSNYRNDLLTQDIGCIAHSTLTEGDGIIYYWSDKGPYMIVNGQIPVPVGLSVTGGGRLETVFLQEGIEQEFQYIKKKAVSLNDRLNKKWITFIPCETLSSGNEKYSNENSRLFVYDYSRDAWVVWSNMNITNGITLHNGELFFTEKTYSDFEDALIYKTFKRHNLNEAWDYEDNTEAIDFSYGSNWETLGEPSIYKKPLKFRLFALESTVNSEPTISFDQENNFLFSIATLTKSLPQPFGGYGISEYGVVGYGEIAEPFFESSLRRDKVRSMRLVFKNSEHQQNAIITGWEVEYNAPFDVQFKK